MSENLANTTNASRRGFLQATAGAAALTGALALERSAHAAGSSDALKIAVIGCGGRGSGAARDALDSGANVKIIALADAFPERIFGQDGRPGSRQSIIDHAKGKGLADSVDLPEDRCFVGFDAYQKALATDCDVAILATPPGFRPIHFEAAIKAGKHVFAEKPVAVDAPGVRRFLASVQEAKEKKLGVGIGLQRHHQNVYLETMQQLWEGAIGDIQYLRVYWNGTTPWVVDRNEKWSEMEYQMRNWYFFNWLCGDHVVEQHIHNLDVANWLMKGHPTKAYGMGGRQVRTGKRFGEIFDHHFVEFEYENGVRCFSQCRHQENTWSSVSEHAVGTKGEVDIGGGRIRGEKNWRFRGNDNAPYVQEHKDLYASIVAGNPYNEGEMGAISTMTAIFARMATYSGRELTWDECFNSNIDLMPKNFAWDAETPLKPNGAGEYAFALPGITQVV